MPAAHHHTSRRLCETSRVPSQSRAATHAAAVAAAAISILLGMGMPTISVYVLLAALVAPSIKHFGVDPMAAHLFVLYFGMMSMITPPVAIAAFAAASVAGADAMRTGFAAVRFGWSAYVVPFLFIAAPELLMIGDAWHIALAVVTALAGVQFGHGLPAGPRLPARR